MAIAAGTGHSVAAITPARRVAARLLRDQRVRDGRSRELLRSSEALSALDERDRALATRLVLGVVASRGALDAAIDSHLRPHSHLEPKVRDALRLASFELMYLDTPPSAAVSQGVELVRLASRRAAALANAVLRRVAERDAPSAAAARARVVADDCSLEDLALTAALPIWLVRALVASRGESFARQLALSLADPAPVYVVGNAAREDATVTQALLSAAGLGPLPTGLPASFELAHPSGLARSDLVGGVRAVPADLASQLVALIAAPAPGGSLLEVGQGRATKTILLQGAALRGGASADIVSVELETGKLRLARERLARAGLSDHCRSLSLDARRLSDDDIPAELRRAFGCVFVDAPCSGAGTLRRHPEIAWSLDSTAALGTLPTLQLQILSAASSRVALGGSLVYSTCSPLVSEDESVVRAFLASPAGQGFSVVPVASAPGLSNAGATAARLVAESMSAEGFFVARQLPSSHDAHFCARLVRKGE